MSENPNETEKKRKSKISKKSKKKSRSSIKNMINDDSVENISKSRNKNENSLSDENKTNKSNISNIKENSNDNENSNSNDNKDKKLMERLKSLEKVNVISLNFDLSNYMKLKGNKNKDNDNDGNIVKDKIVTDDKNKVSSNDNIMITELQSTRYNNSLSAKRFDLMITPSRQKIDFSNIKENVDNNNNNNDYSTFRGKNEDIEFDKNHDYYYKRYKNIRFFLLQICIEIERNFNCLLYPKSQNEKSNGLNSISEVGYSSGTIGSNRYESVKSTISQVPKYNQNFIKKINKYIKKINDIESKLELYMSVNNIGELICNLKEKEKELENVKHINEGLKNIKKNQAKAFKDLNDNILNRKEFDIIEKKISNMKNEIKTKRPELKKLVEDIKEQKWKIKDLQDKIHILNDNISYVEEKQIWENNEKKRLETIKDYRRKIELESKRILELEKNSNQLINEKKKKIKELQKEIPEMKEKLEKINEGIALNKKKINSLNQNITKKKLKNSLDSGNINSKNIKLNKKSKSNNKIIINPIWNQDLNKYKKNKPFDINSFITNVVEKDIESPKLDMNKKSEDIDIINDLKSDIESCLERDRKLYEDKQSFLERVKRKFNKEDAVSKFLNNNEEDGVLDMGKHFYVTERNNNLQIENHLSDKLNSNGINMDYINKLAKENEEETKKTINVESNKDNIICKKDSLLGNINSKLSSIKHDEEEIVEALNYSQDHNTEDFY